MKNQYLAKTFSNNSIIEFILISFDYNFDTPSFMNSNYGSISNSNMKFLRLRKINGDVILTFKGPISDLGIREEIEINVNDFEGTILIIEKLGLKKEDIFRKRRLHYVLSDVCFELDTLDNVPTYLEIETKDKKSMIEICDKLNLDISKGKKGTIVEILPELFGDK